MNKNVMIAASVLVILLGGWYGLTQTHLQDSFSQYIENGEVLTLEAKYSPERVVNDHRQELLLDEQHSLQDPTLKFYPYLLMDVKYIHQDKKSKEGLLLWSQVDGEMVLDTEQWETTQGFSDAILAKANKEDFKILKALAKFGGTISMDVLVKDLQTEGESVEPWIQSTIDKHLVIRKGNNLFLHLENPKILVPPQTRFRHNIAKKPYSQVKAVSKNYSKSEIERIAQSAFGNDFTIRKMREIYLPVYTIDIQNPDGSVLTTDWNALTNKRMDRENIYQKIR